MGLLRAERLYDPDPGQAVSPGGHWAPANPLFTQERGTMKNLLVGATIFAAGLGVGVAVSRTQWSATAKQQPEWIYPQRTSGRVYRFNTQTGRADMLSYDGWKTMDPGDP